jgi:phosphogluconate dehydratase
MPDLHKLIPALGVLIDRGHAVALVTDGRMSGASGKVPAAIHLTPEAAEGGPVSRIRDGDIVHLDADAGILELGVSAHELSARPQAGRAPTDAEWTGTGRELFAAFRRITGPADTGASILAAGLPA